MAQSLFDQRYRYDFIYPRGRSGETLRALDTEDDNREVVIKRPAPNDAPPIRNGQEVSILNERRALQQLAGHAALTELLADGQFFVGGMPHQYIVMERAVGLIIEELVIELNAADERMQELEMLVVIDQLLDLLQAAHARDIVYNDVDAKHLFWNRDRHALKVIDWGNAVFLEGDVVTPQGISRQTDIFQVGELLYFIVTGGRRAEVPRDAGPAFRADFGDDRRRVHSQFQDIISKALHPSTKLRYESIMALRNDLNRYRQPLESDRNRIVGTIQNKLQSRDLSMSELRSLRTMLIPALDRDPGYGAAREAAEGIENRLRDLAVTADLDAVGIYMRNENWDRAIQLLDELAGQAGATTGAQVALLRDICQLLAHESTAEIPEAVREAVDLLIEYEGGRAAQRLLQQNAASSAHVSLIMNVAERISAHLPDVILLHPNLYGLQQSLQALEEQNGDVSEPLSILREIEATLASVSAERLTVSLLRDAYQTSVEQLQRLNPQLQTYAAQHEIPADQLPIAAVQRALNAAMMLADSMHIIGKQVASSPRNVQSALDQSRSIDPANPLWDDLAELLSQLYDRLQACQTYVPVADGTDLEEWLLGTAQKLERYQDRFFDAMLVAMHNGLRTAEREWRAHLEAALWGDRQRSLESLGLAVNAVETIAPALATWFRQLRSVVENTQYVERHAMPGGLGRALADGWSAFDRSQLSDAERLGQQALEIARGEVARHAATRLLDLSRLMRDWVERNGVQSKERTQEALAQVEALFTAGENHHRDEFETQMPGTDTYLKAMSKGLVAIYEQSSTAALRLLYTYYILQGTLDAHAERANDAAFWQQAARQTLVERGGRHILYQTLDEFMNKRRDLEGAATTFARVTGPGALVQLFEIRQTLENNGQARTIQAGIQSLRDLEVAIRDWTDGEFRTAGHKLETAVHSVEQVENTASLSLAPYKQYLMRLMEGAATLSVTARDLQRLIDQRPNQPIPRIGEILNEQVEISQRLIGDERSATIRQWRDTYRTFVEALTADERRSRRLARLDELFRAMFIDRHPVYPLYRHWYAVLDSQSEFQAPATDDPTPRLDNESEVASPAYQGSRYEERQNRSPNTTLSLIVATLAVVLSAILLGLGVFLLRGDGPRTAANTPTPPDSGAVVVDDPTATEADAEAAAQAINTAETTTPTSPPLSATPTETDVPPTATQTPQPTATFTPIPPTMTPTPQPTATFTPIPPTMTPTALPPEGLRGTVDLLDVFNRAPEPLFDAAYFLPIEGGYRLGRGEAGTGQPLQILLDAATLEQYYGNNAAARLRGSEVSLTLRTYDPALINGSGPPVYFGVTLRSAEGNDTAGLQIELVSPSVVNIFTVRNGERTFVDQTSITTNVFRLRLDRDRSGTLLTYINDERLGDPIPFIDPSLPARPAVYVRDGGVVVGISTWQLFLR